MANEKSKPVPGLPGLRVRALADGFRRAGRAWGVQAVEVPAAEFTKAQIEALRNEPQLVVEDCDL